MNRLDTLLLACGTAENRTLLRSIFSESYYLLEADNAAQTTLLLEQNCDCIAAVLLDVSDPEKLSSGLLSNQPAAALLSKVPVIVITADESPEAIEDAFHRGASDVIPIEYDQSAMVHRVENIVHLHAQKRHLEALLAEQSNLLRHANDSIVDALSSIIEYRSVESGQHILRIRRFTKILLEEVHRCCPEYQLDESIIGIISNAAALHDIGKIAIPDAILTKPGPLTQEERQVMQTHTLTGCQILNSLHDVANEDYLRYAHNICHYHHERWDGGGYPEGLKGERIPICAQVVGLADVYDALTTKRVYKDAYTFETAVNMILKGECGIFSPKLLECFKRVTKKYEATARAYADGLSPKSENFDVTLPVPQEQDDDDSLEMAQAKYLSLVHYADVFLMEVDVDLGMYHLIYNPYPELSILREASSFSQLAELLLTKLVVPEDRERVRQFLQRDMGIFLREGHRRTSTRFQVQTRQAPGVADFEVTILRPNPIKENQRRMSILWRKLDSSISAGSDTVKADVSTLSESTYCCRYDREFTLVHVGNQTLELAGYTPEELQILFDNKLLRLVIPEDRDMLCRRFREQLASSTAAQLEYRVRHKDGHTVWVFNKSRLVTGADGNEYLYSFLTDISSTKREIDVLKEQLERYEIILAQTENVLFEWDMVSDSISFSNTWEKIFGFPPITKDVRQVLVSGSFFHPDDLPLLQDSIRNLEKGSSYEMTEVRIATAKGRYLWCRFRASAIREKDGSLSRIAGIIINIDEEKQAEQALQDRAERDALTKLLNKDAGRKHAETYFAQLPAGSGCALLIIDLDNFKQVNDRYGHLFGDAILTQASREIRNLFRNQDIIARIGGDEFMVIMRGVSDRKLVQNRCARLIRIFHGVFQNQNYDLPLSCSIGIALAPEHGSSYFELYQRADQALYYAKDQGKNSFMFYDPQNNAFLTDSRTTTAVSKRIDSDEQPGLADSNIVQYAFQKLYSAQDVDASINNILDLVGRQLNVSRVYVFENSDDNRFCSNTYEWCNDGIRPEITTLQNISYETDIPNYDANFNEQGIFYCPDIRALPKPVYDIVAPQGIQSMLHCAIRDNGVFRGYIGFDECRMPRLWTKEQIQVLTYLSEMLSVFLLKKRAQEKIAQRANDLSSILDNQNAWIYIIDPDTCQLKYLNAKAQQLAPNAQPGMLCHKVFMGLDQRCDGCPSAQILTETTSNAVMDNRHFGLRVQADATAIQWEGERSCLLTCREIPDTK